MAKGENGKKGKEKYCKVQISKCKLQIEKKVV